MAFTAFDDTVAFDAAIPFDGIAASVVSTSDYRPARIEDFDDRRARVDEAV